MTASGPEQTIYIVASTDLKQAEIMMTRIRTQLQKIAELQASGECEVSAATVTLPDDSAGRSLQQQVQAVAERVTEMARHDLSKK